MSWLNTLSQKFTPVIDPIYTKDLYTPLDLSSANNELDIEVLQDPEKHHKAIQDMLVSKNAKVAYGGYLEQRKLYDRSDYFGSENPDDRRNIHLGIDLWCEANTKVLSPLHGTIHSFKENKNFGDYGPTIILKHDINGVIFHTLYGHLSRASLDHISVGQTVTAGQVIATLGRPVENGDYAPHLHFQIIINMQNKRGDYPGVSSINDLDYYKENCPDPNELLKIF